ncbi:MAG: family 10 glycosylhydrolase [Oscillospiraceae bacterium]|nr:family 10 glycosylhydrolase [Oscillospiraceae bacterium]
MRRSLTVIVVIASVLLSACSAAESTQLLNAENYSGIPLPVTSAAQVTTSPVTNRTTTPQRTRETTASRSSSASSASTASTTSRNSEVSSRPTSTTSPQKSSVTSTARTSQSAVEIPKTTRRIETSATQAATTSVMPVSNNSGTNTYRTLNHDMVRGVWISYIELGSVLMGKSESAFRTGFSQMMDNCARFGINTVYVHVRPFGDAIYKSELFPWSKYASGNIATAPDFDPLEIMLEEARKRNISFHAWLNPLRLSRDADMIKLSDKYKIGEWYNGARRGDYIVKVGDMWYLNPAYEPVRKLIADGAAEIVAAYDVDGIHIDDYFYPTTDSSFDSIAFNASSFDSRTDFRFDNINKVVLSLNQSIKRANNSTLFGISPQGSVENNINHLYADVNLWSANTDYCDYILPQIYYGFKNQAQPFEECLARWVNMTRNSGVKLIAGLAVYKAGKEDTWAGEGKDEWQKNSNIISRQLTVANQSNVGVSFFSYSYLFGTESQSAAVQAEIANIRGANSDE